jgi:hypothetical protein
MMELGIFLADLRINRAMRCFDMAGRHKLFIFEDGFRIARDEPVDSIEQVAKKLLGASIPGMVHTVAAVIRDPETGVMYLPNWVKELSTGKQLMFVLPDDKTFIGVECRLTQDLHIEGEENAGKTNNGEPTGTSYFPPPQNSGEDSDVAESGDNGRDAKDS